MGVGGFAKWSTVAKLPRAANDKEAFGWAEPCIYTRRPKEGMDVSVIIIFLSKVWLLAMELGRTGRTGRTEHVHDHKGRPR